MRRVCARVSVAWCLCLGLGAIACALTRPSGMPVRVESVRADGSAGWSQAHAEPWSDRLEDATSLIRERLDGAPGCDAWFREWGVNASIWLKPSTRPTVTRRRLIAPLQSSDEPVCGATRGREPFDVVLVDPRCLRRLDGCELASLLLHELGHLARRDTTDVESEAFFSACRLDACVDPARFR